MMYPLSNLKKGGCRLLALLTTILLLLLPYLFQTAKFDLLVFGISFSHYFAMGVLGAVSFSLAYKYNHLCGWLLFIIIFTLSLFLTNPHAVFFIVWLFLNTIFYDLGWRILDTGPRYRNVKLFTIILFTLAIPAFTFVYGSLNAFVLDIFIISINIISGFLFYDRIKYLKLGYVFPLFGKILTLLANLAYLFINHIRAIQTDSLALYFKGPFQIANFLENPAIEIMMLLATLLLLYAIYTVGIRNRYYITNPMLPIIFPIGFFYVVLRTVLFLLSFHFQWVHYFPPFLLEPSLLSVDFMILLILCLPSFYCNPLEVNIHQLINSTNELHQGIVYCTYMARKTYEQGLPYLALSYSEQGQSYFQLLVDEEQQQLRYYDLSLKRISTNIEAAFIYATLTSKEKKNLKEQPKYLKMCDLESHYIHTLLAYQEKEKTDYSDLVIDSILSLINDYQLSNHQTALQGCYEYVLAILQDKAKKQPHLYLEQYHKVFYDYQNTKQVLMELPNHEENEV